MGAVKKALAPFALLAAAAALLPGCYFAGKAIPTDPSGMKYPAHLAAETLREQVHETGASITGLPAALGRHFKECWRNMAHDPSGL